MAEPDLSKLRIERGAAPSRASRRWRRLLMWALALAAVVAGVLYWRSTAPLAVETVTVATAYPSQAYTLLNATGYVVAQRKAAVASKATGRLEWLGESDQSIRDLVATTTDTGDRTATAEAADWLTDYLADAGGQADSSEVKKAGKMAGHSADALKRARQKLRISAITTGFPRRTIWCSHSQSEHARGGTLSTAPTAPTGDISNKYTDYSRSNGGPVGAVGAVGRVPARGAPTGDDDPQVPRVRL